jgi:hypothetical protein
MSLVAAGFTEFVDKLYERIEPDEGGLDRILGSASVGFSPASLGA